jgi:hypothetical protein
MGQITVKPEQEPEQAKGGFALSGFAFLWVGVN